MSLVVIPDDVAEDIYIRAVGPCVFLNCALEHYYLLTYYGGVLGLTSLYMTKMISDSLYLLCCC